MGIIFFSRGLIPLIIDYKLYTDASVTSGHIIYVGLCAGKDMSRSDYEKYGVLFPYATVERLRHPAHSPCVGLQFTDQNGKSHFLISTINTSKWQQLHEGDIIDIKYLPIYPDIITINGNIFESIDVLFAILGFCILVISLIFIYKKNKQNQMIVYLSQ